MIIGLTGTKASGKGILSEILKEKGFVYSSTSDRVREEALVRGINNYTIKDLQDIGNDLREKFGLGILAKRTLEKLKDTGNSVIDGIRNPGEIEELKKQNAIIIAVDAPQEQRYKRLISRARASDPKDWEGFLEMEKRDSGIGEDSSGQQVSRCMEIADYRIINNGTLEELKTKIEYLLMKLTTQDKQEKSEIKEVYKRPSWDEYFIEISRTVAKRATCDRGRSGCVIVKDKHILVTGYVGSPKGIPHCDEVGHQFKKTIHEDGNITQHCVRTAHAEQNAICHAAKLGIPLEGSTLYCKMTPCHVCAKMIINSGIIRVVAEKDYQASADSKELFKQAGIKLEIVDKEVEKY